LKLDSSQPSPTIQAQPEELDRDWLAAMFARQAIDATDRVRLLAGRPGARATDSAACL